MTQQKSGSKSKVYKIKGQSNRLSEAVHEACEKGISYGRLMADRRKEGKRKYAHKW